MRNDQDSSLGGSQKDNSTSQLTEPESPIAIPGAYAALPDTEQQTLEMVIGKALQRAITVLHEENQLSAEDIHKIHRATVAAAQDAIRANKGGLDAGPTNDKGKRAAAAILRFSDETATWLKDLIASQPELRSCIGPGKHELADELLENVIGVSTGLPTEAPKHSFRKSLIEGRPEGGPGLKP